MLMIMEKISMKKQICKMMTTIMILT